MKSSAFTAKRITGLLLWAYLHTATHAAVVSVNFTTSYIGHGAISASNTNFQNAVMNGRTDILPFTSPTSGVRYAGPAHPVIAQGGGISGVYTLLDGTTTSPVTSLGTTTSAFGLNIPNYSIASLANGSQLPTASAVGTLTSTLAIPGGVTLNAGTQVFADFRAYAMNYNDPASYWYDSETKLQHQVYTGGIMDFYYHDGLGNYFPFASYVNASVHASVDYINKLDT